MRRSTHLAAAQDKPVYKFLAYFTATFQPGVLGLFLLSLLALLLWGSVSDFTREAPEVSN